VNRIHHWFCRTNRWKRRLENELIPWALRGVELGDHLLEIGPGPGLTTEILRRRFTRVTSIEVDSKLALSLRSRLQGTNVHVVEGDATAMPFPAENFSGAVCFTMLHHVPSVELQDRLFRETYRVLKPRAMFIATDSRPSLTMKLIHLRDTMVLIDPETIKGRLERAGFSEISVEVAMGALRFHACRV
jgi:ubiquinone/menaquinone biosynthesis C-methylase UbiE